MTGVLEIYSVLEQAYNIYIDGRYRMGKSYRNPEQVISLSLLYRRLLDELPQLAARVKIVISSCLITTSGSMRYT